MTSHSLTVTSGQRIPLGRASFGTAPLRLEARPAEALGPNALVRWSFYLSIFAIPFSSLYVPGTGERVGVTRIVQALLFCGILSQSRVCLRWVPTALLWFLGYIALRMVWGLWLTPEMTGTWWPDCRVFLSSLLWFWVMFNVLQFSDVRRSGLWALGLGCSLCALFHVAGYGVMAVHDQLETRSSVFGQNANVLGTTYATAITALLGLWMFQRRSLTERVLPFPLIFLIGVAMAKTGSRAAILILATGVLLLLLLGKSCGPWTRRLGGLLMLGTVLAVVLWKIPTVMERFDELNSRNIGENNPRARMAPVLWEMFLRSPIYGSGPCQYQFELTRRAMPYLIKDQKLIASHNLVLLLLVETGIIGLALFSFGLGAALAAAWRVRRAPGGALPLSLLLPLAIGGATVCNPSHDPIFWVAMAYALGWRGLNRLLDQIP